MTGQIARYEQFTLANASIELMEQFNDSIRSSQRKLSSSAKELKLMLGRTNRTVLIRGIGGGSLDPMTVRMANYYFGTRL